MRHEWDAFDPRLSGAGGSTASVASSVGSGTGGEGVGNGGATATSSTAASTSASGGGAGGTGAGGGSGGAPDPLFVDDFERPDAADLGNGWIEKQPDVHSIAGGEVVRVASSTSYRDNLCHRPPAEDVRDVEASIEVRFTAEPFGYPQLFVRAQPVSLATPDTYDGYLLYFDGAGLDTLVLGRQLGSDFVVTLTTITLPAPLNLIDRFRFTLRAQGTDPVQLTGRVEQLGGNGWMVIGEASVDDADPLRIVAPGSVGFAGAETNPFVYDQFQRTVLAP